MNILHYSLGFPPYRTGGMTAFCIDLMAQQYADGHTVSLLWPGKMAPGSTRIRKHHKVDGINSCEIINPLPVPYDEGIVEIEEFVKNGKIKPYRNFLKELHPDVIHIHTLMGLHKSFLEAARDLDIRIVFTTHDFFPVCPKVTMFRNGGVCRSVETCGECAVCNTTALSLNKIKLLQSPLYRMVKNTAVVKKLRKNHRDGYLSQTEHRAEEGSTSSRNADDYKLLRKHYGSMLELMDSIHCNSSISKEVYEKYFNPAVSVVIPISHASITDKRKEKDFDHRILRIRYLGPQGVGKGFFILKEALDEVWKERQDFCLDVHFSPSELSPYIRAHDRYTYSDLEAIFDETDVLVTPSLWYETFGYTVPEALSFGVPVIVSDNVGAKDILEEGSGIVIEKISSDKLCETIRSITPQVLKKMNRNIVQRQDTMTLKEMSDMIEKECYTR